MPTQLDTLRDYWKKACEYDNIPADSKFVAWSENNPFAETYNRLMTFYLRCLREQNTVSDARAKFEAAAKIAEVKKSKLRKVIPRDKVSKSNYVITIDFRSQWKI